MSPREETQVRFANVLEATHGVWTHPLGVLCGMEDLARGGKVRTVTFGVSRTLDAVARIWSPKRLTVQGRGALAHAVEGEFESVESFTEHVWSLLGPHADCAANCPECGDQTMSYDIAQVDDFEATCLSCGRRYYGRFPEPGSTILGGPIDLAKAKGVA